MKLEKVSEDKRGWIYVAAFFNSRGATREAIMIFTRKWYARGGEYHKSVQHDLLLTGSLKWTFRDDLHTWEELHSTPGTAHYIGPGVEHLAEAVEDTLYVEWLDGEFSKVFVPDMRKIVEDRMKNGS
jgi:hypothetical protein